MSTTSQRSDEFKQLFVAYIKASGCNASQITTQYAKASEGKKEINRQKKQDVAGYNAEMDARIAHFWDADHEFWKREENKKYGITPDSPLPVAYANVANFKKQVAKIKSAKGKTTTENAVTPPITTDESIIQLQRDITLLKYKKKVEEAQKLYNLAKSTLDKNPNISTQEEIEAILNAPSTDKADTSE